VHRSSAGALVALSSVVAAALGCSSEDPETISIGEVRVCREARPPTELPPLTADARSAEFFATRPLPLLENQGGPVLRNARMVAVFFGDDPLRERTEAMLKSYGCTSAWHESTSEYGVGDALYERSIVLPEFPAVVGIQAFEDWMRSQASTLGLRADEHVFVFYPPAGAPVPELPCQGSLGFHMSMTLDSGTSVVYAVIDQCPPSLWSTDWDMRAHITSHELMEMAVDPFPAADTAWSGLDGTGFEMVTPGTENADLCNSFHLLPADYPFPVTSGWSNRRARAGLEPCAPADERKPFVVAYPNHNPIDLSTGSAVVDLEFFADDPQLAFNWLATAETSACVATRADGVFNETLTSGAVRHVELTVHSPCVTADTILPRLLIGMWTPDGTTLRNESVPIIGLPP
jgi:hypothetical protein